MRATRFMSAGHGEYHPVKMDPQVESWKYMRDNSWRTFRFTRRTTGLTLLWGVFVPVLVYNIVLRQDLKWDVQGAKREEPIARWGKYALPEGERNPKPVEEDEE